MINFTYIWLHNINKIRFFYFEWGVDERLVYVFVLANALWYAYAEPQTQISTVVAFRNVKLKCLVRKTETCIRRSSHPRQCMSAKCQLIPWCCQLLVVAVSLPPYCYHLFPPTPFIIIYYLLCYLSPSQGANYQLHISLYIVFLFLIYLAPFKMNQIHC